MSDQIDGNSQVDGQPINNVSTHGDIMASLEPGAFGVTETTSDVKAGMGNIETVVLTASDGSSVYAEHHLLGSIPIVEPGQDDMAVEHRQ